MYTGTGERRLYKVLLKHITACTGGQEQHHACGLSKPPQKCCAFGRKDYTALTCPLESLCCRFQQYPPGYT